MRASSLVSSHFIVGSFNKLHFNAPPVARALNFYPRAMPAAGSLPLPSSLSLPLSPWSYIHRITHRSRQSIILVDWNLDQR